MRKVLFDLGRMVLFIILTVLVAVGSSTKTMPPGILHMLSQVRSFTDFVEVFNMEEELKNFTEQLIPSVHSGRSKDGSKVVSLDNEPCRPRPVAVEVEQTGNSNTFRYPFYVKLHRCSGSCGANPFVAECVQSAMQPLKLRVAEITWGYTSNNRMDIGKKVASISMFNATACSCVCKKQSGKCNRFQFWREDNCRCECKGVCPANYDMHPEECCKCARKQQCRHKQRWNPDRCMCECVKGKCRNSRKIRDPRTCKCVCRSAFCRYGGVMNQRNCLCKRRLGSSSFSSFSRLDSQIPSPE